MKYLILYEDGNFWTQEIISEDDKGLSENGVISIINLEDLTFHVEEDTWQQVKQG